MIHEASGRKAGFGELASDAASEEAPKDDAIVLKEKSEWKYIGQSTGIVDMSDIASGKTTYGLDVNLPGIKYATVVRCPVTGGVVKSFNAEKAKNIPGVLQVLEIKSKGFPTDFPNPLGGIVIVADNTWSAISARKELEVEWDLGPNAGYATSDYINDMLSKVKSKGNVRREQGSVDSAFGKASHAIESTYIIPHLAHAPMEPPSAVALLKGWEMRSLGTHSTSAMGKRQCCRGVGHRWRQCNTSCYPFRWSIWQEIKT